MGRQNIQFRGIRHTPSDITGQDGDLLDSVNLVHENGELKPIAMPERSGIIVPTRENRPYYLAHIHNTTDGEMFVFVWHQDNGDDMLYVQNAQNEPTLSRVANDSLKETIKWVDSVGNTLVIGTDKSIHYALYKNNEYKWLGDSLPRPVIDFQLEEGDLILQKDPTPSTIYADQGMASDINLFLRDHTPGHTGNTESLLYNEWFYQGNPSKQSSHNVRDNIISKITRVINNVKEKNQFIYPFFVRYALRLYDGSYVCHSQPILMLPSTYISPFMVELHAREIDSQGNVINVAPGGDWQIKCNTLVYGKGSKLKYLFQNFVDENNNFLLDETVNDWQDIIKGVDIFCSSQLSQLDYNELESDDAFNISFKGAKLQYPSGGVSDYYPPDDWLGYLYSENEKVSVLQSMLDDPNYSTEHMVSWITIPSLSVDDYLDKVANESVFYLAKSYKLNQYQDMMGGNAVYYDEEVNTNTLGSLESSKTLKDDYLSRNKIVSETGHTYNKRLILGNLKSELPLWYPITDSFMSNTASIKLCFVIEKNGKTIYVTAGDSSNAVGYYNFGHFIYYPDPDCNKLLVDFYYSGIHRIHEFTMEEHRGLNGAYVIMPDLMSLAEEMFQTSIQSIDIPQQSKDRYYSMHNSIAMADVANPFVMQAENFREVGNGRVIDLAPNTMEVSSGQWGQYPLYVFTTDGIYAFGINQDGTFGEMSPVSSDVLLHPKELGEPTLIQTNQSLVFLSKRGVMGLSGTKVDLLSHVLEGRHFNVKNELGADVVYNNGAFRSILNETSDTLPFHDFMLDGFLAYDYVHNNVLVLREDSKYQYVLSIDNGLWSRQITYRNLEAVQIASQVTTSVSSRNNTERGATNYLNVVKMSAAINNYTEMFLQGDDNHLYRTNNVREQNDNPLYQYGYFVTRPLRFDTDEFKTITRLLHRYTHYGANSKVSLAMYGSRDGVRYARINTLRGMSWRYYIFVVYTYLKPNERYSYMTVDFEPRLTNKLR